MNKIRNTDPKSEVSHNVLPSKALVANNKVTMPESDKTLKELQEMAILLRQKLDTLESERNVMNVEYSQVGCTFLKSSVIYKNIQ